MPFRATPPTASALTLLVLTACGGGIDGVRARAPADLQCDAAAIHVRAASPAGPPAGPYYAEGCDKLWRYVSPPGGDTQGTDVKQIITKQAGFDLSCAADKLKFASLNGDTFGAEGCGKKASYALVCGTAGCKAVQNTQAQ
jgi:hypothetical protein